MRKQKGFTLIELMVVIVIIGILAALAIPKMLGVSAKAKIAEAPSVASNWETLQSAYTQEKGDVGALATIGFVDVSITAGVSKYWNYTDALTAGTKAVFTATNPVVIGGCTAASAAFVSTYTIATDKAAHTGVAVCTAYTPNW